VTQESIQSKIIEIASVDNYRLKGWEYAPAEPKGVVLVLHGIQSHSGWYDKSSRELAQSGFYVLAMDRRGSGMNENDRGHVSSYKILLEDIEAARKFASARSGIDRIHIEGISWGGKLALAYAAWKPEHVNSVALVAPGLEPKVDMTGKQKAGIGLALAINPKKKFPVPITDGTMFTGNPERIKYIDNDKLSLREATARFYVESSRLGRFWRKKAGIIRCPIMLMLAEHDRIIDNDRSRTVLSILGSDKKTVLEYPAGHHTLEFEPDPAQFFNDLAEWFKTHN